PFSSSGRLNVTHLAVRTPMAANRAEGFRTRFDKRAQQPAQAAALHLRSPRDGFSLVRLSSFRSSTSLISNDLFDSSSANSYAFAPLQSKPDRPWDGKESAGRIAAILPAQSPQKDLRRRSHSEKAL